MIKPEYRFLHRISLAIQGLLIAIKRERHMKIHILLAIILLMPLFWIKPVSPIFGS